MNRTNTTYEISKPVIPMSGSILGKEVKRINDNNISYLQNSYIHENYWFQDLAGTIFNLDLALKILPRNEMTYAEKINSLVRLSIYIGLILALFYTNYLFLYIPIIVMIITYLLYIFRLGELDKTRSENGPNAKLQDITKGQNDNLMKKNINGNHGDSFENLLNIKRCSKPVINNPFMNALVFDSRLRNSACDVIKPENQLAIEKEYNKYCIKDISDIYNHNSGRRQFYTVASTTYPNDQGGFANWLYRTPPTCKEGNGAQCVANYYTPLNSSLLTPGYGSKA